MSILPPTPALMALNQTLAARPRQPLPPEAARAQAKEHAAEAQQEFYRHPKLARIARRQKWIDQSQSLNRFLPQADLKTLGHMVRGARKAGLKTTYLTRTSAPATSKKPPSDVKKNVRITTKPAAMAPSAKSAGNKRRRTARPACPHGVPAIGVTATTPLDNR